MATPYSTAVESYLKANEAGKHSWDGPVEVFSPPCECTLCSDQFFSIGLQTRRIELLYSGEITTASVAILARQYCTYMFKGLQQIQSVINSNGVLIQKRWVKKSETKRRSHLKSLKPDLYESENPLLEIMLKQGKNPFSARMYRKTFLLPYINLEGLSKDGSRMLRLLYYRARHRPEEWVTFDNHQLLAGWAMGVLEDKFNGLHFAAWQVLWTMEALQQDEVHNGDAYGAPRALLILEAQSDLIKFLRDFVFSMLKSTDEYNMEVVTGSPVQTALPSSIQPPLLEDPSWMQFGVSYYNEPFSPPPQFNEIMIDHLMDIVTEKRAEAQDNLWLLQTDPAYFHSVAVYWRDHNEYNIPRAERPKAAINQFLGGRVIYYSITLVGEWEDIEDQLRVVKEQYEVNKAAIRPGHALPVQYDRALGGLGLLVYNHWSHKATHMRELAFVSEAWKSNREVIPGLRIGKEEAFRPKQGCDSMMSSKDTYKSDRIFFCLVALGERNYDTALVLRSLDMYLGSCNKSEAAKINDITYGRITDMAAMYRIYLAIMMHRPPFSVEYGKAFSWKDCDTSRRWRLLNRSSDVLNMLVDEKRARLWRTLEDLNQFRMPTGKKDYVWLEGADRAHKALAKIWSVARDEFRRILQTLNIRKIDIDYLVGLTSYHDSPEALATIAQRRNEILAKISQTATQQKASPEPYESSIPHVALPEGSIKIPIKRVAATKAKAKSGANANCPWSETRKEVNSARTFSESASSSETLPHLPLPKKKKSLHTLRLLFPTVTADLEGTVNWTNFLATMNELGFEAKHRGGSEWTFRSVNRELNQVAGDSAKTSIVIHQPHPETEMGSLQLQWIGKRLGRRFGWSRDRFEGLKDSLQDW